MINLQYPIYLLFAFSCYCFNSKNMIKLDLQKKEYEIKTAFGVIFYEYGDVYENHGSHSFKTPEVYFQFTNIKNISAINFEDLRNEYRVYNVYATLEQINIIKVVAHYLNLERCFMLLTEIFYKTGYINKKICVIETNPKNVYFGDNSFINKSIKKFTFKESDIVSHVSTLLTSERIYNKKINIYDIINFHDFDYFLQEVLKDNYDQTFTAWHEIHHIYTNITITMGNKRIKYLMYATSEDFKIRFFENFLFSEYDLENNEVNLYLNNAADIVIEESHKKIMNQTNKVTIFIYCLVILSIVWTVISRYNKNNNIEYPNDIFDIY